MDVGKCVDHSSYIEQSPIPLLIIPFLQLRDVLSLGSCSKYLNELFKSDEDWIELYKSRWPDSVNSECSKVQYIFRHKHCKAHMSRFLGTVDEWRKHEMLLQRDYLTGIHTMKLLNLRFEDIYLHFFRKNINVVFNLLGLHYAFFCLGLPIKELSKVPVVR